MNEVTGEVEKANVEIPYESICQGLSAIDSGHGIAYVIGFNQTDRKPNLVGFDVKTKSITVDLELPFAEAAQVGVGQALDIDPVTGDIIAVGQAPGTTSGTLGHHFVIRIGFKTKNPLFWQTCPKMYQIWRPYHVLVVATRWITLARLNT